MATQKSTEKSNQERKNIFTEMEEEVLQFWKKNKIFEKSVAKDAPMGEYVFYDGPPFITGLPHYGSILPSIAKDLIPRFWTMNGYSVKRVWGWDCHGLPAENKVEKELGLKNKKDIECFGVDKFVGACREYVRTGSEQWQWYIDRIGRWVDMEHAYKTMDLKFMESVIWAFGELYKKGLIYEGYRTSLHCPRCATPLSKFEITMDAGSYKDVTEKSIVVKFKVKDQENTYFLAWTTTPWTLPGNLALAVGEDIDYVQLKIKNEELRIILAKDRLADILKDKEVEIEKEFKGAELVGLEYEPLFDLKNEKITENKKAYKVYAAPFVTTADGTGIVHIAPNFGEDDFNLGKTVGLPIVDLMDENGAYTKEAGEEFAGVYYKKAGEAVLEKLGERLFSSFDVTHSYPFCYRCGTPLIYRAQKAWYLNIEKIRPQLLAANEKINWVPEHFKEGRFKYNLENAPDWCLSRSRYWGSPIPVWKCACGEIKVIGSLDQLYRESAGALTKIILVRHGEAENNAQNIITGSTDKYSLTEKGRQQIAEAAKKVKAEISGLEDKTIVFSSPVLRAKESAEIIAKEIGLDFKIAEGIREMEFGSWEGQNQDELGVKDGLRKLFNGLSAEEKYSFKRGGNGESGADCGKRVYGWFSEMLGNNKGKTIVIVSHGDPIIDLVNELKSRNEKEAVIAWNGPEYPEKGSVKVVYANSATNKEIDLHKPDIDEISVKCDKCGAETKRVPEVFDCWFESGSMPFAQFHYPFENKEEFEKNFLPADYIIEYTGQLRGWFYYLHVLSNCLFDSIAFKNVNVTGVLSGTDGRKMSKSYGNYPDPKETIEKYGGDALRYYFMASPIMLADDANFNEKDLQDGLRKNLMLLWNVYKFYSMYAESPLLAKEGPGGGFGEAAADSENVLDKWILSRFNQLLKTITENLTKYNLPEATRPLPAFIDDFSTWYLRRSRDRYKESSFEGGGQPRAGQGVFSEDKQAALATTKFVLLELSKAIAPVMPFIAEQLWQKVTGNNFSDSEKSVHLESWPTPLLFKEGFGGGSILDEMAAVRKVVELGLAKRDEAGIKVRQPLNELRVTGYELRKEYEDLVKDELNVKSVVSKSGEGELSVELDTKMTPELVAEGVKRELVRFINAERKNAGLTIGDRIVLHYETASQALKDVLEKFGAELRKDVLAEEISAGAAEGGKEAEINGEKIILKVEKI